MEVAYAVDRFETATTLKVHRLVRAWAGLRTLAPDRTPVAGFDAEAEGFYWLAGQGGYGIQTAPGLASFAASQILGVVVPDDLASQGVSAAQLSPARFRTGAARQQSGRAAS
jgi:D-arginine dehydrogenase